MNTILLTSAVFFKELHFLLFLVFKGRLHCFIIFFEFPNDLQPNYLPTYFFIQPGLSMTFEVYDDPSKVVYDDHFPVLE